MDVNLAALQKYDPNVSSILRSALQVAIYGFNSTKSVWEKHDSEGTMFICTRTDNPRYAMMLLNKLSRDNFSEPITPDMEVAQENQQYLLYRKGEKYIRSIWFFNKQECGSFASTLTKIIEKLSDQKKSAARENGVFQQNQAPNNFHREADTDIASMLNRAQLRNREESAAARPSAGPPLLYKPVPIQVDSLLQSSTPIGADMSAPSMLNLSSVTGVGRRHVQQPGGGSSNVGRQVPQPVLPEANFDAFSAAGNDLLQKILIESASISSPSKLPAVHQMKSLPLASHHAALEFLRTPEPRAAPFHAKNENTAGYSVASDGRTPAARTLDDSHLLLTPADFETNVGDTAEPSHLSGGVGSKNLAPGDSHCSAQDRAALKRVLVDLVQNDDDFVELLYKKLSMQSSKNR